MIKFFRNIRKKLVTEGKTANYIKYAIGEIVLVVIGILIALQVNNWNQERLELNRFNSNLVYMLEDIEQNQIQLNELKNIRKKALEVCTAVINRFRQSQVIPTEVWNKAFFDVVVEERFKANVDGFEKAKSSDVYEKEKFVKARNIVVEYDELIEELNYEESKLNVTIEEIERGLFQNGFYDAIWDNVRANFIDSIKYKKPEVDLNFLELVKEHPEVKGILLRFEVDAPSFLERYEAILKKGEELKIEIKNYLDHNTG